MKLAHRREIDGLRALAVVPVLLFHANVKMFSGGYIGVDIFSEGCRYPFVQSPIIILAAMWLPWVAKGLPETIATMSLTTAQTLWIIGSKDFGRINPLSFVGKEPSYRLSWRNPVQASHRDVNALLRTLLNKDIFIDLQTLICANDFECPLFTPEGDLISHDGSHLTKEGARYVGNRLPQGLIAAINPPLQGGI